METTTHYLKVFEELKRRKRWATDTNILRFVALTLAWAEQPGLASRLETVAAALHERAGWSSPLRSSIRYMVAAMILKRGVDPARVHDAIENTRAEFRERRMRRGGLSEILAALLLVLKEGGRPVPGWRVDRLKDILANWKQDHRWLTGADDYPMAALHATRETSVEEVASGVEQIYQTLRRTGFSRGNQLQLASHLLAISPAPPQQAAKRFESLSKAFRARKWRITASRYDEVAILALCSAQPARLAQQVLRIHERLRAAPSRPGKEIAFSLAAGIALSEDARKQKGMADTRDAAAARMAQAVMEAQQAAVMAAVGATVAASAATTAASSS